MTGASAPRVSVVVPAHDAELFLERAIASALSQSLGDIEVWVIDDGSEDRTAEVADRLASDRRVRLVSRPHRGASAARNEGVRRSRSPYIAFLDADDEWIDPDKLAAQVGLFEANPDLGLSFTDWRFGSAQQEIGEPRLRMLGFSGYDDDATTRSLPVVAVRDLNRPNFGLATSTIVVRALCLDAVGVFDEQLRMYEDLDLWVRLLRVYPVAFLPRATTVVWKHERNSSARRADYPEDLRLVVRKNSLEAEGF
jgi:glycosyltransferase involved in cell wall biosynthesis